MPASSPTTLSAAISQLGPALFQGDEGGHELVGLNLDTALLQGGEVAAAMRHGERHGAVQLVKRTALA